MLVEGQITGGVAQGLGGALFEEFLYDGRGEPLSVSFADYLMPTVREMPPVDVDTQSVSGQHDEPVADWHGFKSRGMVV